jgi:spermidine synthase
MSKKEKIMVAMDQSKAIRKQKLDLWFRDSPEIGRGCALSIRIRDVLCHYHSRFQEIAVFETDQMGRMLVLDDVTMLTEFDEFAYHEMIAHVPMMTHSNPSRVLVIGGGDGGTIREVLKHPGVSEVHLCEIDEEVVAACRKFLPSLASGFDDPRVRCFYEDGAVFVKKHPESYDVIIVDSTDPVGPGQVLFQPPFYRDMKRALTKEGIAVTQCESIYFHPEIIGKVAAFAREIYPLVSYCPHLSEWDHWLHVLLPPTRPRQDGWLGGKGRQTERPQILHPGNSPGGLCIAPLWRNPFRGQVSQAGFCTGIQPSRDRGTPATNSQAIGREASFGGFSPCAVSGSGPRTAREKRPHRPPE